MRNPVCLILLAASLFTSLAGTSPAAAQSSFGDLNTGIGLFAATDDEAGLEVWRSDGTPAGTFRLTDNACTEYCESYTFNAFFAPWVEAGNRAFVLAHDPEESTLWVTDGARAGTFPVYEGPKIWTLQPPVWVKSLFRLVNETGRDELWASDGTRPGTRLLKTIRTGE